MMVYKRRNIDYLLHLDAEDGRFKFAKRLRKESTNAEKALWQELKGRKMMGYKFRRQHPIHYYIADFYCHEQRLIIEVDGKIHLKPEIINHDKNRTEALSRLGIRIIRFSNKEVINKITKVKEEIQSFINNNSINH